MLRIQVLAQVGGCQELGNVNTLRSRLCTEISGEGSGGISGGITKVGRKLGRVGEGHSEVQPFKMRGQVCWEVGLGWSLKWKPGKGGQWEGGHREELP